jgi:hypothetical protein
MAVRGSENGQALVDGGRAGQVARWLDVTSDESDAAAMPTAGAPVRQGDRGSI